MLASKKLLLVELLFLLVLFSYYFYQNFKKNDESINPYFPPLASTFISKAISSKEQTLNLKKSFDEKFSSPVYFSITNTSKNEAKPLVIVNNIDWSSNETIVKTIFQGNMPASTEEKAIKISSYIAKNNVQSDPMIFRWSNLMLPVNFFNQTGYDYCSGFAFTMSELLETLGIKSRVISLSNHVVTEAQYENDWHMFDADGGCYYYNKQGKIASTQEILNDLSLVDVKVPCITNVYSQPKKWIRYYYPKDFDQNFIKIPNLPITIIPTLSSGDEIRFYYAWKEKYYWSYKNKESDVYTNGLLISKITINNSYERKINLPYPILSAKFQGNGICKESQNIKLSVDNGKSWISGKGLCQNGVLDFDKVFPQGLNTFPTYSYLIKVTNTNFKSLNLFTLFQVAPNSIPKLKEGNNKVEVKNVSNGGIIFKFAFVKSDN